MSWTAVHKLVAAIGSGLQWVFIPRSPLLICPARQDLVRKLWLNHCLQKVK